MGLDSSLCPGKAHLAKTPREGLDSLTSFQGSFADANPCGMSRISPSTVPSPGATGSGVFPRLPAVPPLVTAGSAHFPSTQPRFWSGGREKKKHPRPHTQQQHLRSCPWGTNNPEVTTAQQQDDCVGTGDCSRDRSGAPGGHGALGGSGSDRKGVPGSGSARQCQPGAPAALGARLLLVEAPSTLFPSPPLQRIHPIYTHTGHV